MPETKLTPETRRAVQIAVLSGDSALKIAEEYGISRQTVYDQRDLAMSDPEGFLDDAKEEVAHWQRVINLLGR